MHLLTYCCNSSEKDEVEDVYEKPIQQKDQISTPPQEFTPIDESTFLPDKEPDTLQINPGKKIKNKGKKVKHRKSEDKRSSEQKSEPIIIEPVVLPPVVKPPEKKPLKGILKKPKKSF